VCVNATPITIQKNASFLKKLEQTGFNIFKNPVNSNIRDHYRNALATAVKKSDESTSIHFGFIDRMIFILGHDYKISLILEF
jgi:hypothetical protein